MTGALGERRVVSREAWLAERLDLLAAEKALTKARDELAARRRALAWERVDTDYAFATPTGPRSLSELFEGRSQLIVYHFMMGPDWAEGCPSCSFWTDGWDGTQVHLAQRDVTFTLASRAPLSAIEAYRARMGWSLPWVSSLGSTFNEDFGVSISAEAVASGGATYNYASAAQPFEEAPGLSVFAVEEGQVYHTYSCYSRGLDALNVAYQLLDLVPRGRDEDGLDWPMAWLRRHDVYGSEG